MLSSITRSERIIIVEDDRVRSVVIGPQQRLRPALHLAAAGAVCIGLLAGWLLTVVELRDTRRSVAMLADTGDTLAAQLADSRSRLAALGGELDTAREALAGVLAGDAELRGKLETVLATLDGAAGDTTVKGLRQTLTAARDGLQPLTTGAGDHLAAAGRSLEQVGQASLEAAARRAQAALTALEMAAADRLGATAADDAGDGDGGLMSVLAETRAEVRQLRIAVAVADARREEAEQKTTETERRMAAVTDGQVALIGQLSERAELRIGEIESVLRETGIDLNAVLADLENSRFGRGGPLVDIPEAAALAMAPAAGEAMSRLEGLLDRQARLRALFTLLPLGAPLNDFYVSSNFGKRLDPFTNEWAMHTGLDLVSQLRSPVAVTAPGEVVFAGWDSGGYGRMVLVDHGFGINTRYAHLDKLMVKAGQSINQGDTVGTLGNTGRSQGPHLHYEVLVDGRPVNPLRFMERGRHVCEG
ncbi:M23 family metallopeptidase [Rhodospirillum centenum]|uniref:Peptidase M23 n=1 Tax=Rhodospirillum centenum (strain ATCC 51521 / SW) TaxID=414684 RepID=B6IVQ7_RHOCS|nr:M23 family metallopeptidase [Rhodospirillum centenum]ACJ00381.1 peptidase M23 [Rhodospirillum centenum SW]